MKKFLIKIQAVLLALTMAMASQVVHAEKLTEYGTGKPVLLNGTPIELPNELTLDSLKFRGVWIYTVWNQDFPRATGLNEETYRAQYVQLLDKLQSYHINAVVFQVRPCNDAFYRSSLNPISEFLTGTQGEGYTWDPLAFMVEETHRRGMEFHAWFNPYRVTHNDRSDKKDVVLQTLSSENWARKNPNMAFMAGKKMYLKPWEASVREFIRSSVMEVVKNYKIDGVHFDDYFYPAKSTAGSDGFFSEEKAAYDRSGNGYRLDYWRRMQTDELIRSVHTDIQAYNQANGTRIQFGVSPVGIWGLASKHKANSIEGEGIPVSTGFSSYDDQYADTRKWVKEGYVDYIAPQVYWTFSGDYVPYGTITDWWAKTVRGTNVKLYIGQAHYKLNQKTKKKLSWQNPRELMNQLKFNQRYSEISGSIFFSSSSFFDESSFSNENREFLNTFRAEMNRLQGINQMQEKSSSESSDNTSVVKLDYAVHRTQHGNMVQWLNTEEKAYSEFLISRLIHTNGKVEKVPLTKISKKSGSYIYIDYGYHTICEYQVEAVQ